MKSSYGHVQYTFVNPIGKKWEKAKKFVGLVSEKDKRNLRIFFKKLLFSNCSCKHVETSFGSPAAFFRQQKENFSLRVREWLKNNLVFSNYPARDLQLKAETGLLSVREG